MTRDFSIDEDQWAEEAYFRGLADHFKERYDELERTHGPFSSDLGECYE